MPTWLTNLLARLGLVKKKTVADIVAPMQQIHDDLIQHATFKSAEVTVHAEAMLAASKLKAAAQAEIDAADKMRDNFAKLLGIAP